MNGHLGILGDSNSEEGFRFVLLGSQTCCSTGKYGQGPRLMICYLDLCLVYSIIYTLVVGLGFRCVWV